MKNEKYIILDWAGNLKFHGQEFESFEEAWDYIFEFTDTDMDAGEFQVI